MEKGRAVLLAAGGSGGHLFPALAVAEELRSRGHRPFIVTDARGARFAHVADNVEVNVVASATVNLRRPFQWPGAAYKLSRGFIDCYRLIGDRQPAIAVGFGGYPSLPPLAAASLRSVAICLHEANAVLGRANKMLLKRADALALSFVPTEGVDPSDARAKRTGNPLRREVVAYAGAPYPEISRTGPLHLLIFGGSQGAAIFSEYVPQALANMNVDLRARLNIVQQAREQHIGSLQEHYARLGITAEVKTFFDDLPERMARAHLVISRAGAGAVCELATIGRPAVLVPFPSKGDNQQERNARAFAEGGAGWVIRQEDFSASSLSVRLSICFDTPTKLELAARMAASLGERDATMKLTDVVEQLMVASEHPGEAT